MAIWFLLFSVVSSANIPPQTSCSTAFEERTSAFISSVESGGFLGRIAAGFLTDCIIRASRTNQQCKPNLRLRVAIIFMLGNLLFIHLLQVTISESSSMMWIIFTGFALGMNIYGCIVLFQIAASESAPPHLSGSANAIVSLFGNVGAIISGYPFSFIAEYYGWSSLFFALEIAVAFIIPIMLWNRNLKSKYSIVKKNV
ncbi:glucose-6-phosphate exchanger SLC37A4-like isoform X2 [Stegodyphus dumicola]|uniref:glucose-6-phosphate exchanger SLC37A4-like isoform X2 n=1 Tax=Stegodyphus dumicola TaxID=202533 RepID=UPI0015AC9713|nr:glucose-6-phosphate exchanger SLC37A4-like isoform X2 [Stegodyphus dumicola]